MERPCVVGHGRTQQGMYGRARYQVHRTTEQLGEGVRQIFDLPAQACARAQFVEQVDIAAVDILATRDRTEDESAEMP